MARQEIAGKTEHRSVKHFVAAGRELRAAKDKFRRQQSCLMRRGKIAAQKALDAFPVNPELDLSFKIAKVEVPIQSKRGVIDLEVCLACFSRDGVLHNTTELLPPPQWMGQVTTRTTIELKRFGDFLVKVTLQN